MSVVLCLRPPPFFIMVLAVAVLVAFLQSRAVSAVGNLTIDTTSGPVTGLVNGTTPHVAQFLGIPFAEQPVGERRWLPPVAKSREERIDATRFGPGCPQFEGNASNVWLTDAPEFVTPANTTGEECLVVNVWAPWKQQQKKKHNESLPVIAWIYGGGFQTGSGHIEYQLPAQWIERSQKHIVVGINYRLNIFGFPNAAGLKDDEQNLGFLDQRLGLEWIRANIANFGGDPDRITLWGQSAGAISVDNYNFAYPEDPIVSSLIMNSGSSHLPLTAVDPTHTNFTFVANHFGCGNSSAEAEIDCLRNVSSTDIVAFLKTRTDTGATPALSFNPIVDNRTKFSNYTARALAGNYTKKPAIIGTVTHEGQPFLPYDQENGPDEAIANATTLQLFLCPVVQTTLDRYASSTTTFRYLYGGNFSNIAPQWWEGAYHSSELPLIFGTHDIARTPSTPFQYDVSHQMQDYWLAFAEDPINGLPKLGWEAYEPQGQAVLIGYEDVVTQPIAESRLEAPCDGLTPREGALPPP
ncbi:para-nitrobenzyl esterase [Corynespora cassiicola Philippines]|uniref:Carboxylic ester hydrolase n=1 Tax=Corynespora cassiicola Philippines TaxID=1448308 RepID=A0A2T2P0E1_CORCC|nr:para-nitrobenzyl esterase [Corynespora cassiicola Philippines]